MVLEEFNLAHRLNKRLFGLLVDDIAVADLASSHQHVADGAPLRGSRPHHDARDNAVYRRRSARDFFSKGLSRLKAGLQRAGLDTRFFAWPPQDDPDRPPYRGLRPLESGRRIFFDREAPSLRRWTDCACFAMRLRRASSLSSVRPRREIFLSACRVLPRLHRNDGNFLLLPILRPERAAITSENGLLHSLERAIHVQGLVHTRAEIRAAIDGGASTLLPLLALLSSSASPSRVPHKPRHKPPTLVLPIDQGEELFFTEGAVESELLLALLLGVLIGTVPEFIVILTVRSDSYERVQCAKALDGIAQQTLSLPPLPKGAYQAVIEGPAERLRDGPRRLQIEPALTQALLGEVEAGTGRDALPLLAFTLERLYLEYGSGGRLNLSHYEALGLIRALSSCHRASTHRRRRGPKRTARSRHAIITVAASFDPWLAGIDP